MPKVMKHLESLKVCFVDDSFHAMIGIKIIYNKTPLVVLSDGPVLDMDRLHSISGVSCAELTHDMFVQVSPQTILGTVSPENAISIIGTEIPLDGASIKIFPHLETSWNRSKSCEK